MIFSTIARLLLASSSFAAVIQICRSVGMFSRALFKTYNDTTTEFSTHRYRQCTALHLHCIKKKSHSEYTQTECYLPFLHFRTSPVAQEQAKAERHKQIGCQRWGKIKLKSLSVFEIFQLVTQANSEKRNSDCPQQELNL